VSGINGTTFQSFSGARVALKDRRRHQEQVLHSPTFARECDKRRMMTTMMIMMNRSCKRKKRPFTGATHRYAHEQKDIRGHDTNTKGFVDTALPRESRRSSASCLISRSLPLYRSLSLSHSLALHRSFSLAFLAFASSLWLSLALLLFHSRFRAVSLALLLSLVLSRVLLLTDSRTLAFARSLSRSLSPSLALSCFFFAFSRSLSLWLSLALSRSHSRFRVRSFSL
jgi:hypothetical protein